ncbi:MAG: ankyrin repeat domain-containing protein [Treponema sp.]|nr:ankyrin repeat domain-containing protein [Treponema sp.]
MKMMCALSMALFLTFGGIASAQARCDFCDRIFIQAARDDNMVNLRRHLVCSWPNVNAQDDNGKTALMWAVTMQHQCVIDFLLNPPADLRPPNSAAINFNISDNAGMTALMHAIRTNNVVILRSFLREGAGGRINLNHQTRDGTTALHFAVMHGMDNMVRLLIEQPLIDTNLVNEDRDTAFMLAVRQRNRNMLELFAECPRFDVTRSLPLGMPPLLEALRLGLSPFAIGDILMFFPRAMESRDSRGNGPDEWLIASGRYNATDRQRIQDMFDDARIRGRILR